jgi:hypothetical protein
MLAPVHLGPMKPHRHQLGRAKEIAQSLIQKEDAHFLQISVRPNSSALIHEYIATGPWVR